jgi:hypothetical protein
MKNKNELPAPKIRIKHRLKAALKILTITLNEINETTCSLREFIYGSDRNQINNDENDIKINPVRSEILSQFKNYYQDWLKYQAWISNDTTNGYEIEDALNKQYGFKLSEPFFDATPFFEEKSKNPKILQELNSAAKSFFSDWNEAPAIGKLFQQFSDLCRSNSKKEVATFIKSI